MVEKHRSSWKGAMPTYNEVIWKDYKLSVKPIGCRGVFHFKSWYFIPYLNATNVKLALTINTRSKVKREFSYTWVLLRWDGQNENRQKADGRSFVGDAQSRWREDLDIPFLTIPNQYYAQALLHDNESDTTSDWQVVADFTLLSRDMLILRVGVLLLGVIATAILALVIKAFWGD